MRNSADHPSEVCRAGHLPYPAPIDIELLPLIGQKSVELSSVWVRGKKVGIPVVIVGIQENGHCVVPGEHRQAEERVLLHDLIPLEDPVHDAVGLGIQGPNTYVEVFIVIQDTNFRVFRRWFTSNWLVLGETGDGLAFGPEGLGEESVETESTGSFGRNPKGLERQPMGVFLGPEPQEARAQGEGLRELATRGAGRTFTTLSHSQGDWGTPATRIGQHTAFSGVQKGLSTPGIEEIHLTVGHLAPFQVPPRLNRKPRPGPTPG